jgi:hypothetical protein
MSEIVYIKLVSGEELIAEKVSDNTYTNMLQIMMIPIDHENFGARLFPFPFFAQETKTFQFKNPNSVMLETTPDLQYVNMYNERFGKIQIVRNTTLLS